MKSVNAVMLSQCLGLIELIDKIKLLFATIKNLFTMIHEVYRCPRCNLKIDFLDEYCKYCNAKLNWGLK